MTETASSEHSDAPRDDSLVVVALDSGTASELPADPAPRRALLVAAHPDDLDFGAAGTVATWTAEGAEVTYCIVTDGAAGAADPSVDPVTLAATRQQEQRAAAGEVGVEDVVYLGYPDGELEPVRELRRELARLIRKVRPDVVVCPSPERNYLRIRASHPDHLAAGEATLRAVFPDSRNPFAFPELLAEGWQPFEVPEVWLMAAPEPNRPVDITHVFDKKLAALRCHRSQITNPAELAKALTEVGRSMAERFGLPRHHLAEVFQVVDTR